MATSFAAIRDRIRTVVEAATPSFAPVQELYRYKPSNAQTLEEWALSAPASCLRSFSIIRVGFTVDREQFHAADEIPRQEQALLTIAYPRQHDCYGEGYESMEDCMRADIRQVRDLCMSGSTWSAVSGWSGVLDSTINEPVRDGSVWFQSLTLTLAYCEGQTLT